MTRVNRPRPELYRPERSDPEILAEFAESRGFDPEFLAEHGIYIAGPTEAVGGWNVDGWIGIPYFSLSDQWYSRYRNPDPHGHPKYLSPKKVDEKTGGHLYNPLSLGPNAEEVWITEGEFDCLSLIAAGVDAVGVSGINGFKDNWGLLFEESNVVIAFDPDDGGQQGTLIVKRLLPNAKVFQVPEGTDLNDWWRDDADEMEAAIIDFRLEEGL